MIHKDKQTSGLRIQKKITNSRYVNTTSGFGKGFNSMLASRHAVHQPGSALRRQKTCFKLWVQLQEGRLRTVLTHKPHFFLSMRRTFLLDVSSKKYLESHNFILGTVSSVNKVKKKLIMIFCLFVQQYRCSHCCKYPKRRLRQIFAHSAYNFYAP